MLFTLSDDGKDPETNHPLPETVKADTVKENNPPETISTSDSMLQVSPLQKKFFLPILLLGSLAMVGVASMPWLGEVGMAKDGVTDNLGKWIGFLGEFHPVFLHLPIGALGLVLLMEIFRIISFGKYKPKTTMPLFFASATGIFAVVFGYCLYLTGDFTGDFTGGLIEEHKRDGIIFTILLIGTFLIKYASDIKFMGGIAKPFYAIGLIATSGFMISAGHHGGEVTHGDPLDKAPWKLESKSNAKITADPIVYTDIIHPILEAKCISCHGPKKQKSGLRMDTYAYLLEGGEETDCLIPGDIEKSAMISYLHLPLDDDLRMPPEGKKQLTTAEIQILEWWVKIGAPEKANRSELTVTPALAIAFDSLKTPEQIAKEKAAKAESAKKQKAMQDQKRTQLATALDTVNKQFAGSLKYISQQDTALSFSAVSYRQQFNNDSLAILKDAAQDITELDLSATTITDDATQQLEDFTSLQSLNLNQTALTDAALPSLRKLNRLKILNLHSTAVTDEGIKLLHGMSSLKKVFLWNTKVTETGAKNLEKALIDAYNETQQSLPEADRDEDTPQVILGISTK